MGRYHYYPLEYEEDSFKEHQLPLAPDTLRFIIADHVAEIEQLRVQLAGCGVAAMCNTVQSRKQQKCVQGDYGWSQSYQDVVNAVEREISFRSALEVIHDRCIMGHDVVIRQIHEICDSALGHEK